MAQKPRRQVLSWAPAPDPGTPGSPTSIILPPAVDGSLNLSQSSPVMGEPVIALPRGWQHAMLRQGTYEYTPADRVRMGFSLCVRNTGLDTPIDSAMGDELISLYGTNWGDRPVSSIAFQVWDKTHDLTYCYVSQAWVLASGSQDVGSLHIDDLGWWQVGGHGTLWGGQTGGVFSGTIDYPLELLSPHVGDVRYELRYGSSITDGLSSLFDVFRDWEFFGAALTFQWV